MHHLALEGAYRYIAPTKLLRILRARENTFMEEIQKNLQDLIKRKDEMEKHLKDLYNELKGNNIGMKESLVDSEGFPRTDIDVYAIRVLRNKIICLENDLKDMMKDIEEKLYSLHKLVKEDIEIRKRSDSTLNKDEKATFTKMPITSNDTT